jgi:hypothetical protein
MNDRVSGTVLDFGMLHSIMLRISVQFYRLTNRHDFIAADPLGYTVDDMFWSLALAIIRSLEYQNYVQGCNIDYKINVNLYL